jgi:signal transduction histidine kinase
MMNLAINLRAQKSSGVRNYYSTVIKFYQRFVRIVTLKFERSVLAGVVNNTFNPKEREYIIYTNRIIYFVIIFQSIIVFLTMMFSKNMILIATHLLVPFATIFAQALKWLNMIYLSTNLLLLIPTTAIVIFEKQYLIMRGEEGGFFLYFFLMLFVVSMTVRYSNYSLVKIMLLYIYPLSGMILCFINIPTIDNSFIVAHHHVERIFFFNAVGVFSMFTFFLLLQMSLNNKLAKKILNKQKKIAKIIQNNNLYAINAVIIAEEKEKRRFSEELHDSVGQLLATTKANLDLLTIENTDEHSVETISNCMNILKMAISEVRSISHNLMPAVLANFGFYGAAKEICENSRLPNGNRIRFIATSTIQNHYMPGHEISLHLYRIVQESIGNILKHSGATDAYVKIEYINGELNVIISDNGTGIRSNNRNGNGLTNIRNRAVAIAAELFIETSNEWGTCIKIKLNLQKANGFLNYEAAGN